MTQEYRVIIADDLPEARKLLKRFIELIQPMFKIIDEAEDGESLLEKAMIHKPDLILTDIDMPKLKGIDAIRECQKLIPDIKYIFTTAHDSFALEAFELGAVDYILKPIKKERLYSALEKAKNCLNQQSNSVLVKGDKKRIPIKFNRSLFYVLVNDILFIEKSGRKTIIHTHQQEYLCLDTLEELNEYLNSGVVQSHRAFLINLEHVSHITTVGKSYMVYFYGYDKAAQISKQHIKHIQELMETF